MDSSTMPFLLLLQRVVLQIGDGELMHRALDLDASMRRLLPHIRRLPLLSELVAQSGVVHEVREQRIARRNVPRRRRRRRRRRAKERKEAFVAKRRMAIQSRAGEQRSPGDSIGAMVGVVAEQGAGLVQTAGAAEKV
jgi:transposase InsO family protein